MSFAGYFQILCTNGHETIEDARFNRERFSCPVCCAPVDWMNEVDVSQGIKDASGNRIDGYIDLEVDKPAVTCQCSDCGHTHPKNPPTYKHPMRTKKKHESSGQNRNC